MGTWHKTHEAFIRSREWKEIKKRLFLSKLKICEKCGSKINIEVHHINYDRFGGNELESDLMVLCRSCHKKIHGKVGKISLPTYRTKAIKKYNMSKTGKRGWVSLAKAILEEENRPFIFVDKHNAKRIVLKYIK